MGAGETRYLDDDVHTEVLAGLLSDADVDHFASDPHIDPVHIAQYDGVVVAGRAIGAKRDSSNESQILANYLKFGPLGRHIGVPTLLVGVTEQDCKVGLDGEEVTRNFARCALSRFHVVTCCDGASVALLRRFGVPDPWQGADLLFAWTKHARSAARPPLQGANRIALAGELYCFRAFCEGVSNGGGDIAAKVRGADFDLLVFSNEDLGHAERAQKVLVDGGASAAVVDLRGERFESHASLLAPYSGIITTHLPVLVLAMMVGVPVIALDVPGGKCARLLAEIDQASCLIVEGSQDDSVARLQEALQGHLPRVPYERVDQLAEQARIHSSQLRSFLGLSPVAHVDSGTDENGKTRSGQEGSIVRPTPAAVRPAMFTEAKAIPLCWAASTKETAGFANLGDSLSAVMVSALSGRPVRHTGFSERVTKLVAVGSIGHAIRDGVAIVWGTGVSGRAGILAHNAPVTRFHVRAVRGELSAKHYRDSGIDVPEIYGDPVWLLPSIIGEPVEKTYELGIIPHIHDVAFHHPDAPAKADSLRYLVDELDIGSVVLINTWHEPTWEGLLAKVRLIRSCKRIVSQSFHGVVIAEAYGIPVLNFRQQVGTRNGPVRIDLNAPCNTDPRIWEFFKAGRRAHFHMYSQRRDQRTDWGGVIRAVDELWQPFEYDPVPLVEAFPTLLAYDPLSESVATQQHLEALRF